MRTRRPVHSDATTTPVCMSRHEPTYDFASSGKIRRLVFSLGKTLNVDIMASQARVIGLIDLTDPNCKIH